MMTRNMLLSTVAAVCLGSGVLLAQTPSAQVTGSSSRNGDKSTVTVQGCLQTTNDTRTSSGQSSNRGHEEFILTNARINTGGSSGSAVYRLTGLSDADLRPHLNQQVEVTGRIADKQPEGSTDRTASSASGTSGTSGAGASGSTSTTGSTGSANAQSSSSGSSSSMDASNAPTLRASTIRMLSASCSGSGTN
jgi:hypothetical protein